VYVPGRKVGTGVKLKSVLDPLDLVVVKATWGEGKRNNLLTSFTLACMSKNDELLEIGKVSTGIKELKETELDITYADITQILTENIISKTSEKEIIVKPILIMEVNYEEIQKSNNYNSGYALRFPRFIRIRQKQLNEIAHLSDIKNIYQKQRGRVE
jgi:DNA ligase-1